MYPSTKGIPIAVMIIKILSDFSEEEEFETLRLYSGSTVEIRIFGYIPIAAIDINRVIVRQEKAKARKLRSLLVSIRMPAILATTATGRRYKTG